MKFSEATVAIVGVGLMGGSLGLALVSTRACKEVRALVRRDRAVEEVLSSKAAHFAGTDPETILKGVDLVVLATPVRTIETLVSELHRFLKPAAVITDLGSVKRGIVKAMGGLPADFHAVGGHPMCGKETPGISAADPNLFHGKVWITVPTARSSPRVLRLVEEMIDATGAEKITMSADVHDLLVACTSHLPYLLAATLVNVAEENARDHAELWQVAASGFRDVSRVAASDLTMVTDILCANRDNAVAMLEAARDTMSRLVELLTICDEQGLREFLSRVRNRRITMFRNDRPLISRAVSHDYCSSSKFRRDGWRLAPHRKSPLPPFTKGGLGGISGAQANSPTSEITIENLCEHQALRIRPAKRLSGTVNLPGDKSLSHRALLLAALAEGVSRIGNCLMAGVTQAMMDCLQELGVAIEIEGGAEARNGSVNLTISRINGNGLTAPSTPLQCRGSATTMRLLAGVLAGQGFKSTLDGNHRLRTRPMERIVRPLREKGAEILTDNGNAPLHFHPSRLRSSEHLLDEASAQVKSAILLAGLFSEGPTTVIEPHLSRDHTERMLRRLGVPVEEWTDGDGRHVARISGKISSLPALDLDLPSDPSAAAFFLVAGLLVPLGNVKIPNVCLNPGRTGLFEVLLSMGADLNTEDRSDSGGEPTGTVTAFSSDLDAVTVEGALVARMIDEFPIFAVAATQAQGTTCVRDARELRFKESDRIEALAHELNKMGAGIETTVDGFVIRGPVRLRGAAVNAHGDHRLGMSLGVAGMIAEGETLIEGWEAISDSLPNFPGILEQLGADLEW